MNKMIKNKCLPILALSIIFISTDSFSQRRRVYQQPENEFIVSVGANKFLGDIGGYVGEKTFKDFKTSFALSYKYTLPAEVGFGINIDRNIYTGAETNAHNDYRPLTFRSSVWGVNAQVDYIISGGPYALRETKHTFAVFAGAGVALASPQLEGNQAWDELNPGSFEIRTNQKVIAPTAHAGISYKYRFNYNWSVGAELKFTQYFSDYIDGFHPYTSKRDDASTDLRISLGHYIDSHSWKPKTVTRY